ncbi:MAG: phosphodiester glycosidase family protein, partial [Duncaniella sp.]|nr:phosphodiester glycosidase family protein [Duncaniella sp.]
MVIADLNNEYLRVENAVANESAKGTEKIVSAAARLKAPGHKPIAGQNANFWAVSSQAPDGKLFSSQTRNASIRNGKIVTECNMGPESPFGGPVAVTGLMGVSPDNEVYVDYCRPSVVVRINNGIALYTVSQCNKGVHPDEIGMYNSFYGAAREFRPIDAQLSGGFYQLAPAGDATEVILDLAEGQEWMGGCFIDFEVKEVRTEAGHGTLGDHDLALVARGSGKTKLGNIKVGDKVSLKYAFQFSPSSNSEYPLVETAIGGNLLMMRDGNVQSQCNSADYDKMTYARSLYGTSADHKTLYMMVIDKSTDPVYGRSAGLSTAKAAQIAAHFGCSNMMQCDGGGSAELCVTDNIVNKTTETTPRA